MAADPTLDFVAVDLETATAQRASVCAVGIAVVRAGEVVARERWLVRPPTGTDDFSPVNVGVHGIDAAAVAEAPSWDEIADALGLLGESLPFVASNAPLDRAVYEAACAAAGRRPDDLRWLDALDPVRRHLPHLERATLTQAARDLHVPLRDHHDPVQDATATAEVVLALVERTGAATLDELWDRPAATRPAADRPAPATPYVPASLSQSRFPEPPRPAPERREPAAAPAPSSSRAAVAQPARPSTARRLLGVLLVGVALFLAVFFVSGAVVVAEDVSSDPGQAAVGTSITLVSGLLAYLAGRAGVRRLRG